MFCDLEHNDDVLMLYLYLEETFVSNCVRNVAIEAINLPTAVK